MAITMYQLLSITGLYQQIYQDCCWQRVVLSDTDGWLYWK